MTDTFGERDVVKDGLKRARKLGIERANGWIVLHGHELITTDWPSSSPVRILGSFRDTWS